MTPETVVQKIQQAIPDAQVVTSGEECSFSVEVTSDAFTGKNPVQRHRMVNDVFRAELASGELHALSIKTKVPA